MQELENELLNMFHEKGQKAYDDIKIYLSFSANPRKRALMRNILARLYVAEDGRYFLVRDKHS